jgi:hypothetical protein
MNDPQAFVLMLRVDDWGTQVVTSVLSGLRVSFQTISLNRPVASQMPADSPALIDFRERIEHYLKVCRHVIFIVGDAGPARPPDPLLRRLAAMVNERERGGGAVSRLKLGANLPRTLEPQFPRHETVREGDERAVTRFLKQAIPGPLLGGGSKRVPPPSATPKGNTRGGSFLAKRAQDLIAAADKATTMVGESVEAAGLPDRPAFPDDIPPGPDEVICSVYAPRLAAPGDEVLVQAFAHLQEQEDEVATISAAADPGAAKVGSRPLSEQVAEGERLGFHLTLRGAEIDAPDQEFVWEREPLAAQFGVYFPETSQPRDAVGTVLVTKGGVPVGHVKFTLRVVTREQKDGAESAAAERLGGYRRYQRAFVSYASKDRERVLPRVQALAAARIKVFQDFMELEPGERWERGLYKQIDECDVFFLFWSQAARDSKWVCEEAKYARARQEGKDDRPPEIIPIIIEGPPPVSPPEELNFLHFNDKYIYLLKGVEAEAGARRNEQT